MAIREILTVPHPVLKQVSKPVDVVTDDLRALMDDMLETMYAAPGIGLAAVQIGEPIRVIVMDLQEKPEDDPEGEGIKKPRYFVNPEIVWKSEDLAPYAVAGATFAVRLMRALFALVRSVVGLGILGALIGFIYASSAQGPDPLWTAAFGAMVGGGAGLLVGAIRALRILFAPPRRPGR